MIAARCRRTMLMTFTVLGLASSSMAQSLEVRGFADIGMMLFTANDSFTAVLGSSSGLVFGGGGGVILPQNIFVSGRASRFSKEGRRVFASNGEVFDLGIANTVTITPLDISGGYRFGRPRAAVRPYAGGGITWYRYEESDEFATDNGTETFTGFHLLGGAEVRAGKWLGIAGEVQWTSVPNSLGQQSTSVGTAFGETDLGGTAIRAKVIIGR